MGFCLLNNVAVAAAHARARGLERVAIVDWDVHHGNGTQEMFWREPRVLYLSTHQFPFYPGTGDVDEVGEGDGQGLHGERAARGRRRRRRLRERLRARRPARRSRRTRPSSSSSAPASTRPRAIRSRRWSSRPRRSGGWRARSPAWPRRRPRGASMALVLEGGYDLVALEGGVRSAIQGMVEDVATEPGRAPDDEGVERAARAAQKAWAGVS